MNQESVPTGFKKSYKAFQKDHKTSNWLYLWSAPRPDFLVVAYEHIPTGDYIIVLLYRNKNLFRVFWEATLFTKPLVIE